jgi:hypothetical protein
MDILMGTIAIVKRNEDIQRAFIVLVSIYGVNKVEEPLHEVTTT